MSLPKTEEEWRQHAATAAIGGMSGNVVSTACFACGVRFAMLARYESEAAGWVLRCTLCGETFRGELKERRTPDAANDGSKPEEHAREDGQCRAAVVHPGED